MIFFYRAVPLKTQETLSLNEMEIDLGNALFEINKIGLRQI